MKLYVDIGNSKSKWSLVENQIDQRSGSFFNHDIDEFVVPEDIDEVTIASVGRPTFFYLDKFEVSGSVF